MQKTEVWLPDDQTDRLTVSKLRVPRQAGRGLTTNQLFIININATRSSFDFLF